MVESTLLPMSGAYMSQVSVLWAVNPVGELSINHSRRVVSMVPC